MVLNIVATTPCRAAYMENESPVTLTHAFVMAETEITQAPWQALAYPNPSQEPKDPEKPATFISFFEAAAWCNRLSQMEGLEECYDLSVCAGDIGSGCPEGEYYENGCAVDEDTHEMLPQIYNCGGLPTEDVDYTSFHKYQKYSDCPGYRLPTPPEWEYAAKAGTTSHTSNGDVLNDVAAQTCLDQPTLNPIAWYCGNTGGVEDGVIQKVRQKQPNPWGLYDMLGNGGEWSDYISDGKPLDEGDSHPGESLTDPTGPTEGILFAMQGGWFDTLGCYVRPSRPFSQNPYARGDRTSFRPVRTLFDYVPPDAGTDAGK